MPTTAQPAAGTALPATTLTAGIVFARNEADTANGTTLVGTASIATSGYSDTTSFGTDADGRYKIGGSAGQHWNGMAAFGPAITVFHVVKRVSGGALSAYDPNTPRGFILVNQTTRVEGTVFKSDDSLVGVANSGTAATKTASPSSVILIARDDGSGYFARVVVDGVAGTDLPYGGTPKTNTQLDILNRNGSGNATDRLYFTAVWNRALTNAEITTLSANPWAIFDAAAGPTISSQPANQTATAGATATFTVSATGSGTLTYQWQRNGTNISGANAASYTTPATTVTGGTANNGDAFRCVVTDTNGSTTSNAATLTVNAPAAGMKAALNFYYRKGIANV